MATEFKVQVRELEGGIRTFSVAGELDQATAPELRNPLLDAVAGGDGKILVDLSDCSFMDSTGLSVLVEARKRIASGGAGEESRFGICCPDVQVRRLLEITGVDHAIGVHDTKDQALAALSDG